MNAKTALDRLADIIDDMTLDLESANSDNEDLRKQIDEQTLIIENLENEVRFLCLQLFQASISIPLEGHCVDINPFVPNEDSARGKYEYSELW